MPDDNRLSEVLPPAALSAIEAGFKMIRDNLPFLINLTPAERNALPKLGDGRLALDEDAYALMQKNPSLIPTYVDSAELDKDRALREALDGIRLQAQALFDDVEGTEMLAGNEMFNAYRAFYSNSKEAAKRGVSGAQTVVDVLSKYFARPGRPAAAPAAAKVNA